MNYPKELFEQKLNEFFDRQDPSKRVIVPEIVEKFLEEQELVFKHLASVYAKKNGVEDITISNSDIFSVPGSAHSGYVG
ncbi:MAG: hypothetical protein JJT77_08825 [Crocinitomicaceae bacterium]|nr:hypothetical protein [Crocinitomicaceae bacterium]